MSKPWGVVRIFNMKKLIVILALFFISLSSFAASQAGRLGVGMSNHIVSGIQTLSMKLQRNRAEAIGALFGLDSSEDGSFYAIGLKYYRLIYEEPQLNFYSTAAAATFTAKNSDTDETQQGYQLDGLFGTEFSFQGLESVGFSFEFGLGMYNYQEKTHIGTQGYNMLRSAVHFYL